jgi:hypothetical protein
MSAMPKTPVFKDLTIAVFTMLPTAYLGTYLAILVLPSFLRLPTSLSATTKGYPSFIQIDETWYRYPDYRGLPEWLFAPIHHFDRAVLRPGSWSGHHSRTSDSFDWLLGPSNPSATSSPERAAF